MEEVVIALRWAAIAAEWYALAWVAVTRSHAEAERAFTRALERMRPRGRRRTESATQNQG